jgi:hypothetical protein
MPSKSKKQAKTMRAAAHNPKFAKKVGIKQSVARDFEAADKAKSKGRGRTKGATSRSGKRGGR